MSVVLKMVLLNEFPFYVLFVCFIQKYIYAGNVENIKSNKSLSKMPKTNKNINSGLNCVGKIGSFIHSFDIAYIF